MAPSSPQGQQQQYSEKPRQVYGEQYVLGQPLPVGVVTEAMPPVFAEGEARVYGTGQVYPLHETDWVITNVDTGQPELVLSQEAFGTHYEPPRPLQEIEGTWVCSVNTTIQNPTNGQIRFNTATIPAITILALHKLTDANVDYSAALETAVAGDVIYIQSAKEAKNWARLTLTGDAVRQQDQWYQVPVVWTEGSGQTFIEGNNKLLINLELSHRVDRTQVIP